MAARELAPSNPSLLERALRRCPGQCVVCRGWTTQRICSACVERFACAPPRCWTCAARLPEGLAVGLFKGPSDGSKFRCATCLGAAPPLDRTIAALDYAFPWNTLLQHYKFRHAIELASVLLAQLELALERSHAEAPDWLLPVPLSPRRLRERGYNQSLELARPLAARHGLHCDAAMLLRVRDGAHQAGAARQERQRQVHRAFAVEPSRLGALRGTHVAVLDDVMTTGATLFEIARTLRQAGAARVQAWVVARTPADLDD